MPCKAQVAARSHQHFLPECVRCGGRQLRALRSPLLMTTSETAIKGVISAAPGDTQQIKVIIFLIIR